MRRVGVLVLALGLCGFQQAQTHRAKNTIYVGLPQCDNGESNWGTDETTSDHVVLVCWYDAAGPAPTRPDPDPEATIPNPSLNQPLTRVVK